MEKWQYLKGLGGWLRFSRELAAPPRWRGSIAEVRVGFGELCVCANALDGSRLREAEEVLTPMMVFFPRSR